MSTIQAAEVHGRRRDEPSSKRVNACRLFLNLEDSKKPPNLSRTFLLCGQVSDFRGADILLADFPDETKEVIGDRGYDSNQIWLSFAERNITACIPPKKNRKSKPPYNWHLYKKRHPIENMFAKL
nr:transposase [Acetobacter syzygii]